MKVEAVIPTAGLGTRLKSNVLKPLIEINGKPLFLYTLEAFEKSLFISSVIFVVPGQYIAQYQRCLTLSKIKRVKAVIAGGKERCDSVEAGLKTLDGDTDIVVIHDGARPLITTHLIDQSVNLAFKKQAVIVAVPVKATIKRVNQQSFCVQETLNRDELWEAQTPQVFQAAVIKEAYAKRAGWGAVATDDAQLVERLGYDVMVLPGSYENIKVTTQEDLYVMRMILKARDNQAASRANK